MSDYVLFYFLPIVYLLYYGILYIIIIHPKNKLDDEYDSDDEPKVKTYLV